MIIRHYEVFKTPLESTALGQKNWDILRTESNESAYAIEDTIEEYEKNCKQAESYATAAKIIVDVLKKQGCRHCISLGVGKGILEWHIKSQMPELFVECTDYAPATVDKLQKVFPKCDKIHCFDMSEGDYHSFDKKECFLFYRVSEELDYENWCKVFVKMYDAGVKYILYVPDMLATEKLAESMEEKHLQRSERGIEEVFCGWVYSEDVYEKMFFKAGYKLTETGSCGDLRMFLLDRGE